MSGRVEDAGPARRRTGTQLRKIDLLVLSNLTVLAVLGVARYLPRFVTYRGAGNLHEFFVYAALLFGATLVGWAVLRDRADLDVTTLALVQAGLLLHWLGAFVAVGDGRLYDVVLHGEIRFDKLVHFVNGGITVAVLTRATPFGRAALPAPFVAAAVALTTLGLATLVELVEFGVMSTIPNAGPGGPADSMKDLLAVAAGALAVLPFVRRRP